MTMFKFAASLPGLAALPRKLAIRRSRRHLGSARDLLANKKPDEALRAFQRADAIHPLPVAAVSDVVGILVQAKQFDDAAPYARRLLSENPGSRRALRALSRASELSPDVLAGWGRLAQAAPEEVEPWLQIARISLRLHDFPAALEAAERVCDIEPTHSEARHTIASAKAATKHHVTPAHAWVQNHAAQPDNLLETIDDALAAGDITTATVLLGSRASSADLAFSRRRRLLRATLAAEAFSAEAAGNLTTARLSFWRLKEIALDEPDFADGLDRCLFGDAGNAVVEPHDEDLARPDSSDVVDAVIEGRLRHAENLTHTGQLASAKDQWREVQPMLRSAWLGQQSWLVLTQLQDRVLRQLALAKDAGDIAQAWELVDILDGLNQPQETKSAAASLLPQTLAVLRKLSADQSDLTITLSRRYLTHRDDPALSSRLAKALMKEGRNGEALPIWEGLAAQKPNLIGHWLQIARCARSLHRHDLGQAAVERVLTLNGKHAEGLRLAAHFGPAKGARQCAE